MKNLAIVDAANPFVALLTAARTLPENARTPARAHGEHLATMYTPGANYVAVVAF